MLKVEIVMDEEKILRENKYSLEDIYATIDNLCVKNNLIKGEGGMYLGKGSDKDFANCGCVILALGKAEWFIKNVKKWLWYNSDDGKDENDFSVEDLIREMAEAS